MDCTEQRLNYKNDLEKKEKYWNEVTAALSMDYSSTFYLDVDEGTGMACRMTDRIKQAFPMLSQASIPHGEIQRLYAQNYVHPDDRDAFIETTSLENIRRELKDKVCFYTNYRTFDGQGEKYFRVKVVRVGDWKKQHGVMVGFRDIDSEIRKERVQLEMLEDALKQAAAASQAKSSFLSNMSHDIRTPMNAILGYTALAKRHIADRERVQDYLDKIQTSGNHLLGLINDVLDMSRIESGKLSIDPETCSLKKIMDDLKTVMIGQIHEKQLDFCMDVEQIRDENVLCDKLRLNQVLLNILGNAVKYTPDGGEIAVWLTQKPEAKKEGCAAYRFRVKDNGIGMSEEFQTKLFEQFSREHNSTVSGIQGTGLGMAITKRIVDMMDGKISVKSKLGEGSEFIVDLEFPVAQAQKPQPEITGFVVEQAPVCQKLLLVEDNPLNQEIAKEILSEYGFEIEVANNGREAVEMVSQARPGRYDAVLMDIQMPVMNGYEATREIRGLEDKAQAQIPIIAMTANAFDEDRRNALNAGMNEFITKPVDVEKLLGILLR
jgi:signal transduction histidine kinase/ActR/RegA family two-component response regulator